MSVREPQAGETLGHGYLLEKELGRGGFGVVFKARHVGIDRVVAIKVLLATYAAKDPSAKERFRREATIAASLDYPNSLRIFDYGETDEGVFYLVMEYLQGQELAREIRRLGRLPIPRAIHIVRQMLHALMEAHSRGIVHRDIKPDNVMLVRLAYDPDYVKVMDFGIAKMADSGDQITRAGITLGTPRYMPVEQLRGARLSPATDLYAVGLVLYEMLLGQPAFDGDNAVDLALKIMRGDTLKVPDGSGLPGELAAVIEKAAHKDELQRFQSAREFLEAINALPHALLDQDEVDRERFVTDGPGARKARLDHASPGTRVMPQIDGAEIPPGGDFEDVVKTMMLDAQDPATAVGNLPTRAREAKTVALEVESLSANARDETTTVATTTGPVELTTEHRAAGADVPTPHAGPARSHASEALWFGAPPILVVMNAALLIATLILLLRTL